MFVIFTDGCGVHSYQRYVLLPGPALASVAEPAWTTCGEPSPSMPIHWEVWLGVPWTPSANVFGTDHSPETDRMVSPGGAKTTAPDQPDAVDAVPARPAVSAGDAGRRGPWKMSGNSSKSGCTNSSGRDMISCQRAASSGWSRASGQVGSRAPVV